ncbi:MAG: MBOAT family O-acyltransferase, partial [Clostridia bacterium]
LFPQLIAGPIVRYKDIDDQLISRVENTDKFASGIRCFVAGLAKKILFADSAAIIVRYCDASMQFSPTVLTAWMLIIAFTFQIYFDFSGYSDMAIGLGRMLGFEFVENFNYPYISSSITDFWRRWHISLSTWFKEYVYIPLGGNRKGLLIQYRNIAIVWFLTGFWHGASWNFILWGCYFGVLLIIEKIFLLNALKKLPKFVSHIYSLIFIMIGWLIFYFTDISEGFNCFKAMLGIGVPFADDTIIYDFLRYLPTFALCAFAATPLPKRIYNAILTKYEKSYCILPVSTGITMFACITYLVASTFSPFLYFIF